MSYAKARKHHRVAKKTVENNSAKGLFVPYEYKNKLCILALTCFTFVLIKGIIIGYCLSSNND